MQNYGEKPAGFIVDFSQFLQGYSDEILLVSLLFAVGLIHFKNRYHLLLFLCGKHHCCHSVVALLTHFRNRGAFSYQRWYMFIALRFCSCFTEPCNPETRLA
jgi:hypothetical protein